MENNTEGASNSPACAACRHQRKKCKVKDCVIWPHFPSDRMEEFQAVHRVFGIANVTKMMKEVEPDKRAAAAASLRWEAQGWTEDPVLGPLGKFNRLEQELNDLKAANSLVPMVPMDENNIIPQVKESLVVSNVGFPDPYYPTNFGQGWSASVTLPPYYYNQPHQEIIASTLQIPQQQPPNPHIHDMIRGNEYVGTMFPTPLNNVRTSFSSPLSLPIRGEENNVGTIFSSPPSLPIRGDQDNVRTQFSSSTNLQVKREADLAAFCQQHSTNSNPHDVPVDKQHKK